MRFGGIVVFVFQESSNTNESTVVLKSLGCVFLKMGSDSHFWGHSPLATVSWLSGGHKHNATINLSCTSVITFLIQDFV
ncbi:hypothetical protein CEXT_636691 [Caerostris extrusa]|uniref:Uncharacterized protein n=1 Tax=Caerostris extrusa TaxID=172846 RepID=A0AAV4QH94_CAEEX|nr:hypothetical protein CEXT_636691 [Caerostris extrusa]